MRLHTGDWKVKITDHFLIYYEKNSPAEKDIASLARLLESYFTDITQMYSIHLKEKISYFFHNHQLYHYHIPIWGVATQRNIHSIYMDVKRDSSSHELRHFIQNIVNADAPYFFDEGMCGLGVQIGNKSFHRRVRDWAKDLNHYPLKNLVNDFQKYGRFGDYLAYSFNTFLVEQYGREKYASFYQKVTQENWEKLLEEIYDISLHELEQNWKDFLLRI